MAASCATDTSHGMPGEGCCIRSLRAPASPPASARQAHVTGRLASMPVRKAMGFVVELAQADSTLWRRGDVSERQTGRLFVQPVSGL